jgi:hypothetical protein
MGKKPTAANDQKPALSLFGNVYTTDEVELLELADEDPDSLPEQLREEVAHGDRLTPGDLKAYSQLDAEGRMAARGGHTNFGFSGYFSASIFDGAKWRLFDLRTIVPENESGFAAQKDKEDAIVRIRKRVQSASGRQCVWTVPEGKTRGRYMAIAQQD